MKITLSKASILAICGIAIFHCYDGKVASDDKQGTPDKHVGNFKTKKVRPEIAAYYEDSSSEDEVGNEAAFKEEAAVKAFFGAHEERRWEEIFTDMREDIQDIRQKLGGLSLMEKKDGLEDGLYEHVSELESMVGAVPGQKTICDVLDELMARMNCHLETAGAKGKGKYLVMHIPLPEDASPIPPLEKISQLVELIKTARVFYQK